MAATQAHCKRLFGGAGEWLASRVRPDPLVPTAPRPGRRARPRDFKDGGLRCQERVSYRWACLLSLFIASRRMRANVPIGEGIKIFSNLCNHVRNSSFLGHVAFTPNMVASRLRLNAVSKLGRPPWVCSQRKVGVGHH